MQGKSWRIQSRHNSFLDADNSRKAILTEDPDTDTKVRRMSDNTFVVKTRKSQPDPVKELKKKQKPKTRASRRAERENRKKKQTAQ